ncbi:MAG TPA: hypothetical protein VF981_01410 [Gemmatimonadaceae bacterium]
MSSPPPATHSVPSSERVLRRLFLTLFLRGRTSRGTGQFRKKGGPPTSVGRKLALVLGFYAFFGLYSLSLLGQTVFVLATYLHAMTLVLVGMYVASSAGEVLFNKEEGDILLHRPIEPSVLLRARIAMLVQVSLWLAGAFNLVGLFVGIGARDGGWLFPLVHAGSAVMEALFCTATVVVVYQLCLRWFGREKLDAFMTATQVIVSIAVVLGGQIVPQLMLRLEGTTLVSVGDWWVAFLPPAWFAGIDDAIAGSGSGNAWWLALLGVAATSGVVWLALSRLAGDYQSGLQTMSESAPRKPRRGRRGLIDRLVGVPPLRWWLQDPVSRASFRLTASYLARDRDVKLRIWPGIAPMLAIPFLIMLPSGGDADDVMNVAGVGFGAAYLGLAPLMALNMLEFSQQYQATDVFRLAPMRGPAALTHGARRAVLVLVAFPMMVAYGGIMLLTGQPASALVMLLPGLISLPVFAMFPGLGGHGVPFSRAPETHKGAGRTLYIVGAMIASGVVAGISAWAHSTGWLGWMLTGETLLALTLYFTMRATVQRAKWGSLE